MIEIKDDFHLKFSIYKKSTNTDKYLDFRSNHPTCHKLSVVDTLVNRAIKICDDKTLDNELTHIKKVLMINNYPKTLIQKRIYRMKTFLNDPNATQRNQLGDSEIIRRVPIPYIGKVSIAIAQTIRRTTDIEVCFRPVNKISTMLSNNKQVTKDQIGIYKLNCNDCSTIYVGETGRDIHIRAKEHMNDIRLEKPTSGPYSNIQEFPSHHFSPNNIIKGGNGSDRICSNPIRSDNPIVLSDRITLNPIRSDRNFRIGSPQIRSDNNPIGKQYLRMNEKMRVHSRFFR